MTGQCCTIEPASGSLVRQLSKITGALLPGALLVLLPKCPLCLAAWLTLATGLSFSATGAAWVRPIMMTLWVTGLVAIFWRGIRNVRQHS